MKPRHLLLALAVCAALFAATLATRPITAAFPKLTPRSEGAFPENGHFAGKPLAHAKNVRFWGSWAGDDANSGAIAIGPFKAPALLRFAVSGYPTRDGNQLYLELDGTSNRVPVKLVFDIGERWEITDVEVPAAWVGKQVTLHARDASSGPGGWLALSEPLRGGRGSGLAELCETLAAWTINGLLFGLLWFALLRWITARGWVAAHWAPLVAAGCVAACGYLALWAYFAHEIFGMIFSGVVLTCGAIGALRRPTSAETPGVEALAAPKLLLAIGVFYVALLHFFPSSRDFYSLAANRYRDSLPGDNTLPHNMAVDLFHGRPTRWPGADWLSSDRPPLQSGWMLLTWPATAALQIEDRAAGGTATLWLQSLWVFGAYGLLRTLGLARARACAWLGVLALSGFFVQHTVFTWPKLSAAAFAVGAFGLWCFPRAPGTDVPATSAAPGVARFLLGAGLAALAWLSHGGVAFSFLVLAPWLAWRALRGEWRSWALAAIVFLAFALPWMAYQRFYDPPGNRLLKWHLGGVAPKDARGTWETIRTSYHALTWKEIWAHKAFNLRCQIEGDWRWWSDWSAAGAAHRRNDEFFFTARAFTWWLLGILALPFALMRGRLRDVWRVHAVLATWSIVTVIVWCLLMFTGGQAVIHQGSFVVMLGIFALLSVWCELAARWSLAIVGGLQAALFATTWAVPNDVVRGPLNVLAVGLSAAALAIGAWLIVREHRDSEER